MRLSRVHPLCVVELNLPETNQHRAFMLLHAQRHHCVALPAI